MQTLFADWREPLQERLDRLHLWLASIDVKALRPGRPHFPSIAFDRLHEAVRRLMATSLAIARGTLTRMRRIEFGSKTRAPQPQIEAFADNLHGVFVRMLAYVAGIGALSILAAELLRTAPVVAASDPAPMRSEWTTVDKPFPAFHLGLPGFAEDGQYAIRRHDEGGGRKDVITWGEPGRSLRYVMVEIYRPGSELDAFGDAASEIAARAANLGPASSARASFPINSKFGPVSTIDFAIGRFGGGHCVGFARAFDEPRLQISGLSCNMDSIVDREAISCALDRLTLMSAGSHPDIAKLFAQAELKRTFCGQRDPLMYATPKRPGDTGKLVPLNLRGRTSAR